MEPLEHVFLLLLLLFSLIRTQQVIQKRYTNVLLFLGLLLVWLPPILHFPIPWDFVVFLMIPILFWQQSSGWFTTPSRDYFYAAGIWMLAALFLGGALYFANLKDWAILILLGTLTTSMMSIIFSPSKPVGFFQQIGPLTLILLLTETSTDIGSFTYSLSDLISGAGIGLASAMVMVSIMNHLTRLRPGFLLLQSYLVYVLAMVIQASPIAAVFVNIFVLRSGNKEETGKQKKVFDQLADHPVTFISQLGIFTFLGWQIHRPPQPTLLLETFVGLLVGCLFLAVSKQINISRFTSPHAILLPIFQLGLYLLSMLSFWPQLSEVMLVDLIPIFILATLLPILAVILVAALKSLDLEVRL